MFLVTSHRSSLLIISLSSSFLDYLEPDNGNRVSMDDGANWATGLTNSDDDAGQHQHEPAPDGFNAFLPRSLGSSEDLEMEPSGFRSRCEFHPTMTGGRWWSFSMIKPMQLMNIQ
jgi:hypothetical protein